jgi:hypothetical protein
MAIHQSRNMTDELNRGISDASYMHVAPDWGGDGVQPRWERLMWPTYQQVEQHAEDPFEGHPLNCGCQHHEVMTRGTPTAFDKYRFSASPDSPRFRD